MWKLIIKILMWTFLKWIIPSEIVKMWKLIFKYCGALYFGKTCYTLHFQAFYFPNMKLSTPLLINDFSVLFVYNRCILINIWVINVRGNIFLNLNLASIKKFSCIAFHFENAVPWSLELKNHSVKSQLYSCQHPQSL